MLSPSVLPRATCWLTKLIHLLDRAGKKSNQTEPPATAPWEDTGLGCTSRLVSLDPPGMDYKWEREKQKWGQHEDHVKKPNRQPDWEGVGTTIVASTGASSSRGLIS